MLVFNGLGCKNCSKPFNTLGGEKGYKDMVIENEVKCPYNPSQQDHDFKISRTSGSQAKDHMEDMGAH